MLIVYDAHSDSTNRSNRRCRLTSRKLSTLFKPRLSGAQRGKRHLLKKLRLRLIAKPAALPLRPQLGKSVKRAVFKVLFTDPEPDLLGRDGEEGSQLMELDWQR
jgi:hypothetical protein